MDKVPMTPQGHASLKEELRRLKEGRIVDIEDKLARADVIDTTTLGGSRIKFGARVKLEDADSGKVVEYRIVGPDESDINAGTISVTSPMAKALIGREVGDEVQVKAPGGVRTYEVVDIAWA